MENKREATQIRGDKCTSRKKKITKMADGIKYDTFFIHIIKYEFCKLWYDFRICFGFKSETVSK